MGLIKSSSTISSSPESVFAAKYELLLQWAMHFAQNDRARAEDLVHDTFVQFMLSRREVLDAENAEPLLHTYLKYVHLAQVRSAERYPCQNVSTIEFDSIQLGLRETRLRDPIEVQDELRRIVAFASWRKESAKSASILILRFVHGYYPDEIAPIAQLGPSKVRRGLSDAREEIKSHLADPTRLRIMHHGAPPEVMPKYLALPADELIAELRQTIFAACCSPCLPEKQLLERYATADRKPIECELLAHIVSCERCLKVVGRFHGLDAGGDRHPVDALGMAPKMRGNSRSNSRSKVSVEDSLRRCLRVGRTRIREAFEHQPRRLMVAFNGHIVAAHDVNAQDSRLDVEVGSGVGPLEFIQVMSEQGICLLAMHVDSLPPDAPPVVRRGVELSHGRRLDLLLHFAGAGLPVVEMSYRDPLWDAAAVLDDEIDAAAPSLPFPANRPLSRSRLRPLLDLLEKVRGSSISDMNPTLATAHLLAASSLACFFLWLNQPPAITANALLARAETWSSISQAMNGQGASGAVVHQEVRIKTARRRIDRSIYRDVRGLRHPKPQKLTPENEQLRSRLEIAGVPWDEPLSAASYQQWHDRQHIREDKITRLGNHLLKLTTTVPEGSVAQASLTVRETDFHPVERSVEFRNSETTEIAELSYEVVPWSSTLEGLFEPLSASSSVVPHHVRPSLPVHVFTHVTEMQLDLAELKARLVLSQLHADTTGRVEVTRNPTSVVVKGLVETEAQKQELETHLHEVPNAIAAISSFQDFETKTDAGSQVTSLKSASVVAEPSPLERFLLEKGTSHDAAAELLHVLFSSSVTVSQESRSIADLTERFHQAEQLTPEARRAHGVQQLSGRWLRDD